MARALTSEGVKLPLDPPIEDTLAALLATSVLGVVVAGLYWLLTGLSPWPFVVLGEIGGLGFGVAMLALAAPRRTR
jgi:hypothetical protein